MRCIGPALALLLASVQARGETIDQLVVDRDGKRYRIELQAHLDAAVADSYAVFHDFNNLPRINPAVEQVESLPVAATALPRWRTRVRMCIGFFCTRLDQVQDVRSTQQGEARLMQATVIPQLSNLRYGLADWQLAPCGAQTCLHFTAALEPDFWVPPLLGPWLIERTMRRQAQRTAHGIESLARQLAAARTVPTR